MPSEMRHPGPVAIDSFVAALDRQLREEMARIERRSLPAAWHRIARLLKVVLQPILQSGAMVLTSLAVIVAVGVAPATTTVSRPIDTPVAAPAPWSVAVDGERPDAYLPPDAFVTATGATVDQAADISDTPRIARQ